MRPRRLQTLLVASSLACALPAHSQDSVRIDHKVERFDPTICLQNPTEPKSHNCLAHFAVAEDFADYAIMAADTYRAMTRLDWRRLRRDSLQAKLEKRGNGKPPAQMVTSDQATADDAQEPESNRPSSASPAEQEAEQQKQKEEKLKREVADDNEWDAAASLQYGKHHYFPRDIKTLGYENCAPFKGKDSRKKETDFETSLPLVIPGWERLFDFDRGAPTPRFLSFVPGLFIEVWVKDPAPAAQSATPPHAEYAIVFRGTQEGGGILSNLRFLTTTLLIFHDQYDQARKLYPRLREQIIFREQEKVLEAGTTRGAPMITVVGHSLGAGLAMHVAIHHEGIHRIVGFNPSPITGYFAKSYCQRAENLRTVQSVHFVYENSEALHFIDSREHGDLIDPTLSTRIQFHKVNLIGSDAFSQHAIGPMACKLAAIKKGLPAEIVTGQPRLADEKIQRMSLTKNAPVTDEEKRAAVVEANRKRGQKKSCEIPTPATPLQAPEAL